VDIASLELSYRNKETTPTKVLREIYAAIRAQGERPVWIAVVDEELNLKQAKRLERMEDKSKLPLYGIPFAVKDNFDVAGCRLLRAVRHLRMKLMRRLTRFSGCWMRGRF